MKRARLFIQKRLGVCTPNTSHLNSILFRDESGTGSAKIIEYIPRRFCQSGLEESSALLELARPILLHLRMRTKTGRLQLETMIDLCQVCGSKRHVTARVWEHHVVLHVGSATWSCPLLLRSSLHSYVM